jgi:Tfp pilus assembly protein PilO
LKEHEVTSDAGKSTGTARPGGNDTKETVSKLILRVRTTGSYRSFAEYVRRLQNSERFFRITEFKLSPDTAQLKGTLTVELYYLPVKQ